MTIATNSPPYGQVEWLGPRVRRVLARNPSSFTYTGTGTYIVGQGTVAVIDPGPNDPEHISAIERAVAGETVSHLLITHTHMDHSPAAPPLQARLGGRIAGCKPLPRQADGDPYADSSFDHAYAPDEVLADGDAVSGPGWTLQALHTPGHTSNHLCFAFPEEETLFTGDHVMGWSTTVVVPPDGDMAAYVRSLELLLGRSDQRYLPTHGPAVTEPQRLVRGMIAQRRQREAQILQMLANKSADVPSMVQQVYAMVDRKLWNAAGLSMLAHLIDLEARGQVRRDGALWVKC